MEHSLTDQASFNKIINDIKAEHNWQRLAPLIGFFQANKGSGLEYSILPVLDIFSLATGMK